MVDKPRQRCPVAGPAGERFDPARRCLPVSQWPEPWQVAWHRAVDKAPLLSGRGRAGRRLAPDTLQKYRRGFGRWVTFLLRSGAALPDLPADAVIPANVAAYLTELRSQKVAPYTLRGRVVELLSVMLALAPGLNWRWLKDLTNQLEEVARETTPPRVPPLLTRDITDKALARLKALRDAATKSRRVALEYRTWLLVAMLATEALRRRNMTQLDLGRHFHRVGGELVLRFDANEMKGKVRHEVLVPALLRADLQHYTAAVRPLLLGQQRHGGLWVGYAGTTLVEHTISTTVTRFTLRHFGVAISPHMFRAIAATTSEIVDPDGGERAAAWLAHRSTKTTAGYIRRQGLAASHRHAEAVRRRRAATKPMGKPARAKQDKPRK